jgi:predicted nucleic acid-binding protein
MTFVDPNVLVYATAVGAPLRNRARASLAQTASGERTRPYVSRQVLREYIAAVTRPQAWGQPLSLAAAIDDASIFADQFAVLEDGPLIWQHLVRLGKAYPFGGRQVHDANIVATMLAFGERRLLTFNEADFRRFVPLIEIIVP